MLAIAMLSHEQDKLIKLSAPGHELWTPRTIAYLLASCVVGLAISFTGWYCRSQVTANPNPNPNPNPRSGGCQLTRSISPS